MTGPAQDFEPGADLELSTLRTRWLGHRVRSRHSVDSTNLRLRDWAREGAPAGAICVAREQTAGRGRQGRTWRSDPDQGLYLSLLLRPERRLAELAALSLAVGVACAEALESTAALPVQLKWPNDLLVRGRKVGGILLDSWNDPEPTVVVGIGLNLRPPADGWDGLSGIATSLAEEAGGEPVGRDPLLVAVLERVEPAVDTYLEAGLAPFLGAWRARSALDGQPVDVDRGGRRETVRVLGLDESGGLRVRDAAGADVVLHSGEVHLGDRR